MRWLLIILLLIWTFQLCDRVDTLKQKVNQLEIKCTKH